MSWFKKIMTAVLESRTKTVLNAIKDAPELKKSGQDMHDAFVRFNNSLEKASQSNQSELEKLRAEGRAKKVKKKK